MAITRAVASSITQGLPKSKSTLNGNLPIYAGSYESIQTVTVGAGGQSTISFTSIPSTYSHLQIRASGRNASTLTAEDDLLMKFNSDTGANYTIHYIVGDGSGVYTAGVSGRSDPRGGFTVDGNALANTFSATVIDILDYSNVNKYTTTRTLSGSERNGAGRVILESGLWVNTAAVTRIDFTNANSSNFAQYSSFALYGIR